MIASATKDAKERAEKIAENSGSSLGNLKRQQWVLFRSRLPTQTKIIPTAGHSILLLKKRKQALL